MKTIALQTARAGSKSVINKNITEINGKPLYQHNLEAALMSEKIDGVYVSTDCDFILQNKIEKINYIKRPDYLCEDNSSHHEVMRHGLKAIESELTRKIEYFVLLLGNSIIKDYKKIDEAIEILEKNKNFDSVITVSEFNMFNPYRSFRIENGNLINFMNNFAKTQNLKSNDKDAFGSFYYLNGEFQVMRRKCIVSDGPPPFRWMGQKIYPLVLENNMEVDSEWQMDLLRRIYD